MTARTTLVRLFPAFAWVLAACQGATEPQFNAVRDVRGEYQVTWWVSYHRDDSTLVAKAQCAGTVMIARQDSGTFRGTARVGRGGRWPCQEAVLPISGTLERLRSAGPVGQAPGWRLRLDSAPEAAFGGCSFVERAPGLRAQSRDRGEGEIGPNGEIDLTWYGDIYDCQGQRYETHAGLSGARSPA